jgi:hypothetical protein
MSSTKTRTLRIAVASVVAALATFGGAQAAGAATAPCDSGAYCFYGDANYRGWELTYFTTSSGNFSNPPYSGVNHLDQLSSIINNGSRTICIYNNGVVLLRVAPYQDVSYVTDAKNDKADYWKSFAGSVNCPLS